MRWFILFILFFTTVSYSQDVLYGKRVDFNFLLTHEVFKEADSLNINFDQVHVSFVVTKGCKAENFKIVRFAKLKSYNEAVLKYSDKIMEYFLKDIKCPQEKDIIHYYPIRFYLK